MDSCHATIHHAVTKHCFPSKLNWTLCVILKNLKEMCDIHAYFVIFIVEKVYYIKIILRQGNSSYYLQQMCGSLSVCMTNFHPLGF